MDQRRWMQTPQEFNFEIKYSTRKENDAVVDALSRKVSLLALSMILYSFVIRVQEHINQDNLFTSIIVLLMQESKTSHEIKRVQGYKLEYGCMYFNNGCMYFNNGLFIPDVDEIKRRTLSEAHDRPKSRHLGYIKTYVSVKKSFILAQTQEGYISPCLSVFDMSKSQI